MVNCFTIRDTIHKEQNELIAEFKRNFNNYYSGWGCVHPRCR